LPNVGPTEIIVVLVVVLLIFGPRRLPELGRSSGSAIRQFKQGLTDTREAASITAADAAPAKRDAGGA
jgi:sec-independent protein translocase protein TatA